MKPPLASMLLPFTAPNKRTTTASAAVVAATVETPSTSTKIKRISSSSTESTAQQQITSRIQTTKKNKQSSAIIYTDIDDDDDADVSLNKNRAFNNNFIKNCKNNNKFSCYFTATTKCITKLFSNLNNIKISNFVIIYAIIFLICVNFESIHAYTVNNNNFNKNNHNNNNNDDNIDKKDIKLKLPLLSEATRKLGTTITTSEESAFETVFNKLPLSEKEVTATDTATIVSKSSIITNDDTLSSAASPSLSFTSHSPEGKLQTSSLFKKSSSLQNLHQINKNINGNDAGNDDHDNDRKRSNNSSSSRNNKKKLNVNRMINNKDWNKNDAVVYHNNDDIKVKINIRKTDSVTDDNNEDYDDDIKYRRDHYNNQLDASKNLNNNGNTKDDDDFYNILQNHRYYRRDHHLQQQRFRHLWINNRKKRQLLKQNDQTGTNTDTLPLSLSSSSSSPSSLNFTTSSPAATVSTIYNGWKRDHIMDIEQLNDRQGSCSSSFFTCGDGKCIPLRWKCDSKPDCNDGSDESAECAHETKCNEGQFQCTFSRKCIPEKWLCDGDYDCGKIYDLSDEQNCSNTNKCLSYETKCDNGYCLDISKFCDGKWDCDSDEKYCENKTILCSKMNCEYQCTSTSQGPKCYCPPGKEPNGTKCQDFDECKINGVCDQICNNTPGSYVCSCVSGYTNINNRCYAINVPKNESASLVFLTQGDIRTTTLDGKQLSLYQNQDTSAIEIWHRNRTVCAMYTSPSSPILRCHKIEDLNINWKMQIPQILNGLNSIDQIRIDWISNNWYFLNNELSLIFMCTSDMKYCSIILENVLNKPSSMALDPTKGLLFITEWSPSLTRCNLDGSNRIIIATNKIFYPSEITLDLANEHVYWIDTFTDFVERVDYDGNNRWSMKKSTESHLFIKALHSLDIFENTIYLSSWSSKSISAMDKFTLKVERIISKVVRPFDLRVFHRQKQPEVAHPCRHKNGGCSHICVPLWKDKFAIPQCICSAGYKLKSKTECIPDNTDVFLLYVKQRFTRIKGIPLLSSSSSSSSSSVITTMNGTVDIEKNLNSQNVNNNSREVIVPIYNVKWPLAFDINVKQQRIYFMQIDVRNFSISSQKLDGTDRIILLNGTDSVTGIAYDWISDHIYWGDLYKIYVVSLKDITLKRSFDIQHSPESIAIDPIQGIVYWSHWSSGNTGGMIKSAWFDGTHKNVLVESSEHYPMKWPDSLTINIEEKKIYWCDIEEKSIERINMDGTNREILLKHELYSPTSIAYHNHFIYWVDNENGSIMMFNINDDKIDSKTKNFKTLIFEKERIANLKIFNNHSQTETNACINSKCPGLCLQTPIGPICKCSNGFSLNGNGSKCIPHINFEIPSNCTKGFTCKKTKQCIESKDLCDGYDDCDDGSDEDYSDIGICNVKNCDLNVNFVCDNTRCLQKSLRCSGMTYCIDGTDQKNCTICKTEEFTCKKSGKCIPKSWVNDGAKDCGPDDMSDEMTDDEMLLLYARCPEFECKNKLCVQFVEVCDGLNQCGDNSDEVDCDSQCGENEKYCVPIGCYSKAHLCDGIIACLDASDELNCTTVPPTDNYYEKITPICGYKEFACKEGFECIPEHFRCDGINHCYDKSDEKDCEKIKKTDEKQLKMNETKMICNHPDRLCSISNKCITVDKLCDGTMDCEDGTDEGFRCFEKICDHNTDCSHYCHNAPEGFVCSCPLHMYLQPNGLRCSMEHSCEYWDTCSQICEKQGKTYSCKCYEGYTLQYDKFSCKSNAKDSPYVIFSNRQEIRGVDLKTSAVKNFYASLRNTIALDFLFLNNSIQIFWTDVIDDKIYRGTLIGESIGNVEAVVQSGLSTAEGLAVDWIAMNLYWIDSNLDQIEVALVNGSFRRTLVAGEMESPRAIALDPREGWLFWTDWDENFPRIERCSMAGEYRQIIVQVNQISGAWPNGLTLDYTQKRVYWVDARSDSIHTTNYDGKDHHLVIRDQETLSHPFSISLFENYVYWTDWRTNSVIRTNKWNGSDIQVIHRTQTQPFGIQVLHSSRQPKDINPCGTNNGGCSHLCLINVNKTYKCECPHVMRLDQKDQKTCVPNEQVLLFIMGNEIRGIDLMQPNHHTIPTISHSPQVLGPQRIDYTVDDNRLYWSDTQLNEVKTAGLSNGLIETILNTDIQKPFGFAVDWISKHLYVSSVKSKCSILVCNIKGEYVTEIHRDLNIVESIALDPANGKMYWSHSNKETEVYEIEISAFDGSSRRQLYNCSKPAQSLTIDFDSNRLYFVYYNSGIISYYDLALQKVFDVLSSSEVMSISSVTVYNNSLYFPENIQSVIMSCDKNNCHQTMNILRKNTNSVQALKMYYLGAQKGTNTCAKDKGGCQHLCLAVSNVGHVCKCAIGFDQDINNPTQCVGKSELLLYSIGHEIKGSKLYSKEEAMTLNLDEEEKDKVLGPIPLISLATNIDYHIEENYIYWADSEKGTITRVKRDGTHREVILKQLDQLDPNNSDWLGGIAVDWVANNIYWSDQKRNIIEVARLNGSCRYIVISSVEKPTALAVDPVAGLLFYVGEGFIGRTGLDGSQTFILVNQTKSVSNLVLDIDNQMVYWCETGNDFIMRVDYDGNRKTIMLNHSLDNPVALALINNLMYWADNSHHKGTIKVASVHNLSDYSTIVKSEGNSIKDLKIFSRRIQQATNICTDNNGGCQELCLFNGTHPVCACSHGRVAPDGKSCEDHDIFLIYSTGTTIESIHMTDHTNMNSPIETIKNFTYMRNIIGLSFDYESRRIFYSDIHLSTINMVYFNGTNHTTIVNHQVTVEGLSFDPLNSQLYWTSNNDASIRSLDLKLIGSNIDNNTLLVKQILKLNSHDKPRGIQVEPCLAMVYWTNWNSQAASIQRAYVSGYGLESVIKTDIRMPNALALDHEQRKLYWADARLDKVERADYDGSHRVVLAHSTPKHPFAMAVYGDILFWTDWVLHAVVRANKYSGSDVIFLRKDIGRPMGIAAVQNLIHNCDANKCNIVNGGCEDVCLLDKDNNVLCQCTRGKLAPDGHSCIQPTSGKCAKGEFLCSSGECIPYTLTCDDVPHCLDQSDERTSFCFARECPENFFMCSNRRCILMNQTCDGVEDCGDLSDEIFCPCDKGRFKCNSGECLDESLKCDNMADCHDASDEMNCPLRECASGDALFFHCETTTACYMQSWICDGENDCWDRSDETNCENITKPACGPGQFRCDNGHCINERWRCDGEDDCNDGKQPPSDEMNCQVQCKPNEFKCDNTCIPSTWQCDETPDCRDGSDEGPQCAQRECSEFMFKCNSSGRCIPQKWVCDGEADCVGKEDEPEDCAIVSITRLDSCYPPYFLCTSGECLEPHHVCDGDSDCEHGDDEYTGCVPSQWAHPECNSNEFRCDNNECIPKNATCDLKNDCSDNSDENPKMCQNSTKICAGLNFFRCANGACVHSSKLCDGRNDCGDFSDEQSCEVNECLIKDLCSQNCTDLKVGYECSCFKGFKVHHLNRDLCEDVDECVEERPCSQICYNTVGSYHCGCIEGFQLKHKTVCKATSNEHTELIFSNRYYIRKVGIQGNMSILMHQLSNAVALDFEWESGCLFWSDVTSTVSMIKKHCLKENKTTTLHHTMMKNPDGLAVDWVGHNLYWCDKGLDTIEVSKLDGRYRRILIDKNLREPRGIALDPFRRYIYWSDWGEMPYIGKAGMDGSKQKIIIQTNLGWPNALTISFETNELFWGDAREDFIAVSDLDGKNQRILLSRSINPTLKLHHVFAIAVWEDKIFWSDWETKSIEYCHKYSGQNCSTLTNTIHRPMDLRIYHPYRQLQPKTPNPCDTAGCSTLCLLSPDPPYYQCMCPNNFILQNDTKSCKSNCTAAHFECVNTYKCIPFYWECDTQDDCGDNSDEPATCRRYYCEPGQYQCENTKCISPSSICDGTDNCGDKSDEKNCDSFTCFENYFKCGSGQSAYCIDATKKCDGHKDCAHGEDEENCKQVACQKNQFQCPNGKCIPLVWVCDGDNDCRDDDRTDELHCGERNCSSKEFLCKSGRCIPKSWRCDGENDCLEGEDEPPTCYSSQDHVCEPTYFKCNNSKCIPGRWRCDYDNDCGDNSDEMNCLLRNCSESEFRCGTGKCIKYDHRCDGEVDCEDGTDEINCNITCKANEFKCANFNTCINMKYKCDGDDDCPDGSDEVNCTCPSDHFVCSNGKCIMNRWRCDGWSDCADGSDESIEVCAHIPCHANAFKCPNLKCIRKSALCDGINDCGDNSDETQKICESLPKCRHDQFQCENDVCISKKLRCDGQYNCVDGSDEMNCQSPVCGFGRCSQICIEKKAENYNCKCVDGYHKGKEKNDTCLATGQEQILLLASEQEFRFMLPQKHQGTTVMGFVQTGSLKIDVFDVLIRQKDTLLFWIDSHHNKIHTMRLDTLSEMKYESSHRRKRSIQDLTVFDIPNLDDPKSLAVDWVTLKLYVIDSKHNKIIATDIEGKKYVSLVSTGMHPTDIVLEPESRIMIWSTLENGILVSSLDGTNKKSLVEIDVGWPISLSIDYPTGRLYWVDYRKGTIETCLLNGKDRHVVKRFQNSEKPQKIDVFEDFLYIKLYDQSIIRMNKFGNDNGTYVLKGYRSSDIAIIHPLKQNRNITNPCIKYPCEDKNAMCILSSDSNTGRTCTCPSDMIMAKIDGKSECKTFESIPEYCPLKCSTGHCKIVDHIPKCICPPEFDGEMCEHYRCSGYCLNGGYCQVLLEEMNPDSHDPPPLKCKCKEEWSGTRCNISVTECQNRCHNGGTCSIVEDVQSCECPNGFLGDKCEHCVNLTCENGAVCRETVTGSTQCDCPDGYYGKRCETNVCDGYCNGHGKCINLIRGPHCECDPGYWGKQCETNSCKDYCLNGGACINNGDEPICTCSQRYSGKRCEIDLCQTAHPPEFCDSSIVSTRTPCTGIECQNGGVCHIIRNMGICNCTEQWNGELCEKRVGYDNSCSGFCSNGAICQLDNFMSPTCICIGEWGGMKCNNPPACMNGCGVCRTGSSINECLCEDGSVSPCNFESTNMLSEERQNTAEILTILAVILSILILMISLFGAAIMFLKKRRLGQPFSHARLTDNVEITNPMYLGDIDETPSFVHEDDKGNFANPVYESMYAGSIQDQTQLENNSTAPDERKGLLQHSHDEHNAQQDIL